MTDQPPFYDARPCASWLPVHEALVQNAPVIAPLRVGEILDLPTDSSLHRIEQWQRGISELFTDLSPEALEPETFTGRIETIHRGNLSVSHIAAGAQRVHREGTQSRGATLDRFYLNVQLEGHGFVRDHRGEIQLSVGDCVLVDPNQSYVLDFRSPFRQLCIQIEQWWFREKLGFPPEKLLGLPVSLGRGSGPVLRAALEAVIDPPEAEETATAELVELFGDVMTRVLRMAGQDSPAPPLGRAETLFFDRLCQLVAENYRDETLTAVTAAGSLGSSVRYVHKVCYNRGTTFGRLVMDARLASAARALTVPGMRHHIGTVAYDSGFSDLSHFSRVFRKKFGRSPSSYRDSLS